MKKSGVKKSKKQDKKRENKKKSVRIPFYKKKLFWIIFLIIALILLIYLFTHFYLYFKYLLGNDVIVKLNFENKDLFLKHNEKAKVSFESSIIANPFCSVNCDYIFVDLAENNTIDSGNFVMKTLKPFNKDYNLTAPKTGIGLKIYRFELECRAISSSFCYTSKRDSKRIAIISLNYDLADEEKIIKEDIEKNFYNISSQLDLIFQNTELFENLILNNSHINLDSESENLTSLKNKVLDLNNSLSKFNKTWENQDYTSLESDFLIIQDSFEIINGSYLFFYSSFNKTLKSYDNLISSVLKLHNQTAYYTGLNLSNQTIDALDSLIYHFNNFTFNFSASYSIEEKEKDFNELENKFDYVFSLINNKSENSDSLSDVALIPFNYTKINFMPVNFSEGYYLNKNNEVCCFMNSCTKCCDEFCSSDKSLFPIIFIHGHDFSSEVSAENNLNIFVELQKNLEEKLGIYAFGSSLVNEPFNVYSSWKKLNIPVSLSSSYYYDTILDGENIDILETKKDNIDTYAIRLKNIIDTIKIKTGKDKVVIISHSMGGLVVRRYLQVFGDSEVNKVIMITSPNHGVGGSIDTYCGFFGEDSECEDMSEDSVFIKKLNTQTIPSIEVHNIIGIGCRTNNEESDGIVTNKSAYLNWAKNYYINGNCSGFEYLHSDILYTDKYPELPELVVQILKEKK